MTSDPSNPPHPMNQLTYTPDEPTCLETDGTFPFSSKVHRYPGYYCTRAGVRTDCPRHAQRAPENDNPWYDEQRQARRIHALLEAGKDRGHLTERAYQEIMRRLITLHPMCLDKF